MAFNSTASLNTHLQIIPQQLLKYLQVRPCGVMAFRTINYTARLNLKNFTY